MKVVREVGPDICRDISLARDTEEVHLSERVHYLTGGEVLPASVHFLLKEHYSMRGIKARMKMTEILYIFFGIHTANAVELSGRIKGLQPAAG